MTRACYRARVGRLRNCEVGHSRKLREHGVPAKWGDSPEDWENHGGRIGGILQATGKLAAGGVGEYSRKQEK